MLETESRCFVHHLRGLFDRQVLARTRDHFDAVEAERQAIIGSPHENARLRIGASTDAFRLDSRWYDPWRAMDAAGIDRLRPFTWLFYPVMIRHVTRPEHLVPWHQDIAYVRRMPRVHNHLITCFVPLEPEPAQAAGLQFALGDFPDLDHDDFGDHGPAMDRSFPHTAGFDLDFGDALVFGDHTPHRTVPGRDGSIDRRSFEYRAVIPDQALDDKDYYDLDRRCMVRRSDGKVVETAL